MIEYRLVLPLFLDADLTIGTQPLAIITQNGDPRSRKQAMAEMKQRYVSIAEHLWRLKTSTLSGAETSKSVSTFGPTVSGFIREHIGRIYSFVAGNAFELLLDRVSPSIHEPVLRIAKNTTAPDKTAATDPAWPSIVLPPVADLRQLCNTLDDDFDEISWKALALMLWMTTGRLGTEDKVGIAAGLPSVPRGCPQLGDDWNAAYAAAHKWMSEKKSARDVSERLCKRLTDQEICIQIAPWGLLVPSFRWTKLFQTLEDTWRATYYISCDPIQGNYYERESERATGQAPLTWDLNLDVLCYVPARTPVERYVTGDLRLAFLQKCMFYTKCGFPYMSAGASDGVPGE